MDLKIFPSDQPIDELSTFFDINNDAYCYVDTPDKANLCVTDYKSHNFHTIDFDLFHNYENQYGILLSRVKKHDVTIITNAVDKHESSDKIIFVDFLFNRTKAYYQQYPFSVGVKPWYFHDQLSFISPQLITSEYKEKIFVSPSKKGQPPREHRVKLVQELEKYKNMGYIGSYDKPGDPFLYSHLEFPNPGYSIRELEQESRLISYDFWGYCPPHNNYYTNSFISIYVETISFGNTIAPTEKTYDPLIKGHFILPYSTSGFVKYLTNRGIQFPNFIDYSYDEYDNDSLRWKMYTKEIERLCSKDLDWWKDQWNNNLDILMNNKKYFILNDYERIDISRLI